MEDPVAEIPQVVKMLCTTPPKVQRDVIERYFTQTASFTHPFCRTGSFTGSRWLIIQIYRWYKIMSPKIEISIDSVELLARRRHDWLAGVEEMTGESQLTQLQAFDEANLLLYLSMRQVFRIWAIPFHRSDVSLTTVLKLTTDPYPHQHPPAPRSSSSDHNDQAGGKSPPNDDKTRYWIQSQDDLYQTSEFVKFALPWGIGLTLVMLWQFVATLFCVFGAVLGWPVTWLQENIVGGNLERIGDDASRKNS